ncbi:sensor histidine kinase [Streptomyces pathocidini]|uniref:Sensor histidine kinase n=1 Tax=Streptomyces pathocidini TaxID=1650571 RepID=A0ABW7UUT7_9ACTN|nr:histidine kinase [Streptomyces pathocidini]
MIFVINPGIWLWSGEHWGVVVLGKACILVTVGLVAYQLGRDAGPHIRFPLRCLAVLAVAVYLPLPWVGLVWADTAVLLGWAVVTIGRSWSWMALIAVLVMEALVLAWFGESIRSVIYHLTVAGLSSLVIYAVVYAMNVTRQLEKSRQELAQAAVVEERLRMARDLHDFLGQSLAAAALRAELVEHAVQVGDEDRALEELRKMQQVLKSSTCELRDVATGHRQLTFDEELRGAIALLESAGIHCRLRIGAEPRFSNEVLARTLRECVTNILKHSAASECTLTTSLAAERFTMTMENDGAHGKMNMDGTGLHGISSKIAAVGGRMSYGPTAGGFFRIHVEIAANEVA